MIDRLPSGVVIEMAVTRAAAGRFGRYRANGHHIVSYSEESSAAFDVDEFRQVYFDEHAGDLLEILVSWGDWHDRMIPGELSDQGKVVSAGHPRLEVVQPEWQPIFDRTVRYIRKRFGRIVLLNTTIPDFCLSQYPDGVTREHQRIRNKEQKDGYRDARSLESLVARRDVEREIFAAQVRIANEFMRRTGIRVIMRPRPTVSGRELTREARKMGFRGVVDHRYSIAPWLCCASAILHHGCTTSIEAAVAGVPAVMYSKNTKGLAAPTIDVSIVKSSEKDAVEALESVCGPRRPEYVAMARDAVSRWYHQVNGSPSDKLLDELERRGLPVLSCDARYPRNQLSIANLAGLAKEYLIGGRDRVDRPANLLPLSYREARACVASINRLSGTDIRVGVLGEQVYSISRAR